MAALVHLTAMDGGNAGGLREQSLPCAMDSDEPMDTDEPWAGMSSQAHEPTGSGLTAPGTEFVPVRCGRERSLRHEENRWCRGWRYARVLVQR